MLWESVLSALGGLGAGVTQLTLPHLFMIAIGCVLLYLGVAKGIEPLLFVPIGFGAILVNIPLAALMEEGGFLYSADSYADDLPYWVRGPREPFLIIPYTLDANDMCFGTTSGFGSGDQFFTYLKDGFDYLYAEGERGSPKMMSVGLHCRLAGRPNRSAALARFLDYVASHEKVWLPRRIDIAWHWHAHHKPG